MGGRERARARARARARERVRTIVHFVWPVREGMVCDRSACVVVSSDAGVLLGVDAARGGVRRVLSAVFFEGWNARECNLQQLALLRRGNVVRPQHQHLGALRLVQRLCAIGVMEHRLFFSPVRLVVRKRLVAQLAPISSSSSVLGSQRGREVAPHLGGKVQVTCGEL